MRIIMRAASLAAGLLLVGVPPSRAGSPPLRSADWAAPPPTASSATKVFLANAVPNVDFLDRASRLALKNSKSAKVRAFAFAEAREATLVANAIYAWTQAAGTPTIAIATAANLDRMSTGSTLPAKATVSPPSARSIGSVKPEMAETDSSAIERAKASPTKSDDRLPCGQEDLDSLEGLEGAAFDAEYKNKQREALQQVASDDAAYIAAGDDSVLRAIAKGALPEVKKRLAALDKL